MIKAFNSGKDIFLYCNDDITFTNKMTSRVTKFNGDDLLKLETQIKINKVNPQTQQIEGLATVIDKSDITPHILGGKLSMTAPPGSIGGARRKTRKRKFNKKKSKRNRNRKTKNRIRKNKNRKYSKKRN